MKILRLKSPYKEMALAKQKRDGNPLNETVDIFSLRNVGGFYFDPEGRDFWFLVNKGGSPEITDEIKAHYPEIFNEVERGITISNPPAVELPAKPEDEALKFFHSHSQTIHGNDYLDEEDFLKYATLSAQQHTAEEWLLCAAIDYNGKIICGRRHGDCYAILEGWVKSDELPTRDEQGFLTSTGRFVDRKEGYLIAKAANQIKYGGKATEDTLISENLY